MIIVQLFMLNCMTDITLNTYEETAFWPLRESILFVSFINTDMRLLSSI